MERERLLWRYFLISSISYTRQSIFPWHCFRTAKFLAKSRDLGLVWGSPIPLLKTVSRMSNSPFHASRKMQKTSWRSQKKASSHVSRKNATAKSCFTKKHKYYSRFAKHTNTIITKMYLNILPDITEMCYSRYSCTWPSFNNFGLCSRRCLDLLWLG